MTNPKAKTAAEKIYEMFDKFHGVGYSADLVNDIAIELESYAEERVKAITELAKLEIKNLRGACYSKAAEQDLREAFRAGQERMRKRAVEKAEECIEHYEPGGQFVIMNRMVFDLIRALMTEEK